MMDSKWYIIRDDLTLVEVIDRKRFSFHASSTQYKATSFQSCNEATGMKDTISADYPDYSFAVVRFTYTREVQAILDEQKTQTSRITFAERVHHELARHSRTQGEPKE